MDYNTLAENITELDDSIAGAMIVRRGDLLGSYARPKVPIPQKEKFTKMFLQAEMMLSIPKTNQDVFGKVEVVIVRHSILHIYMILLPDKATLAFATRADAEYDFKKVVDDVFKLIRSTRFDSK
jgi:hypothetical protein